MSLGMRRKSRTSRPQNRGQPHETPSVALMQTKAATDRKRKALFLSTTQVAADRAAAEACEGHPMLNT